METTSYDNEKVEQMTREELRKAVANKEISGEQYSKAIAKLLSKKEDE